MPLGLTAWRMSYRNVTKRVGSAEITTKDIVAKDLGVLIREFMNPADDWGALQ